MRTIENQRSAEACGTPAAQHLRPRVCLVCARKFRPDNRYNFICHSCTKDCKYKGTPVVVHRLAFHHVTS